MIELKQPRVNDGEHLPVVAKTDSPDRSPGKSAPVPDDSPRPSDDEDNRRIRCRQCLAEITRPAYRIAVLGAYQHTFANPAGIVFDIGCFSFVTGITHTGPETDEFTWFQGYQWKIALCRECLVHLGWRFGAPHRSTFYGLIVDRLRFPGTGE
jgi:hypothetical protein